MNLLQYSASRFPAILLSHPHRAHRSFTVRSSFDLPFPEHNAKYYTELRTAVDAVERACRLCIDVKKTLFSSDGHILQKNDLTPVTVADFGVQALISLELSKLFPSIPLVAEEDSAFLQANNLVSSVVNVVSDKASVRDKPLTHADVLEAIDRGGKDSFVFGPKPATYWVLDPIDGTRGFVRGGEALYVVGLALVVEGEIVLGVMGCPNWQEESSDKSLPDNRECDNFVHSGSGSIMVAHIGCGTWKMRLSNMLSGMDRVPDCWTRCSVDWHHLVNEALFCIPESQTWESLPLSASFDATTNVELAEDKHICLLSACCGSLCKYMMVASGRASVFILRSRAEKAIKVWDHAVGMICVHEAGGKVSDWNGHQLDLAADLVERRTIFPCGGVLVTNNTLHDQILGMIPSSSPVV